MVEFNPATMNPASIILPSTIENIGRNTDYFEYTIIFILIIIIIFMIMNMNKNKK